MFRKRVPVHNDDVGQLSGLDGPQVVELAVEQRGVAGRHADDLHGRDPVAHEKVHLLPGGLIVEVHRRARIRADYEADSVPVQLSHLGRVMPVGLLGAGEVVEPAEVVQRTSHILVDVRGEIGLQLRVVESFRVFGRNVVDPAHQRGDRGHDSVLRDETERFFRIKRVPAPSHVLDGAHPHFGCRAHLLDRSRVYGHVQSGPVGLGRDGHPFFGCELVELDDLDNIHPRIDELARLAGGVLRPVHRPADKRLCPVVVACALRNRQALLQEGSGDEEPRADHATRVDLLPNPDSVLQRGTQVPGCGYPRHEELPGRDLHDLAPAPHVARKVLVVDTVAYDDEVGVRLVQPRHDRQPVCVDHPRASRDLGIRSRSYVNDAVPLD